MLPGRYWVAATYEERHSRGQEPQNIDKEFLRLWFRSNCDPYKDKVRLAFPRLDLVRWTSWLWPVRCLYYIVTCCRYIWLLVLMVCSQAIRQVSHALVCRLIRNVWQPAGGCCFHLHGVVNGLA